MAGYGTLPTLCLLGVVFQLHAIHLPHLGSCPHVNTKTFFDIKRYQGYWFQRAGYNTERVDGDIRCYNAFFEFGDDDDDFNLVYVHAEGIDNKANVWKEMNGTIKYSNTSWEYNEAKLNLSLDKGANKVVEEPYWVLDTDYSTFSVVYSCKNHLDGLFHYYSVWLLARTPFHLTDLENATYTEGTNRALEFNNISNVYKSDLSRCNVD